MDHDAFCAPSMDRRCVGGPLHKRHVLPLLNCVHAAPGNSVVMARSTMPLFAFAAMQLRVGRWVKAVLVGCCVGLAFVFGTEHGLALALALTLVVAIPLAQRLFGNPTAERYTIQSLKFAIIALGTALVSATGVLCLLCGAQGALKAVHYTLLEVPADQFWFTTGPPLPYLSAWSQLIFDRHAILCLLPVLFTAGVLVWMLRQFRNRPVQLGGGWEALVIFMLTYGLLSCVGVVGSLSKHYFLPLLRILSFVGLVLFANRAQIPGLSLSPVAEWKAWRFVPIAFAILCLTAAVALASMSSVAAYGLVQASGLARHARIQLTVSCQEMGFIHGSSHGPTRFTADQSPYVSLVAVLRASGVALRHLSARGRLHYP